jgi:hypothetical protein
VLLYAVNEDSQHHQAARSWLDHVLRGATTVAGRDRHVVQGTAVTPGGTTRAASSAPSSKAASANAGWKNR